MISNLASHLARLLTPRRSPLLAYIMLVLAVLACNLPTGAPPTQTPRPGPTDLPSDGTRPTVTIVTPQSGSQVLVNQQFFVRVHTVDTIGITRVEMRESGRVVVSQPLPDPSTDSTVDLAYRATNIGTVSLEVVAYRRSVGSNPVAIIVEVVGSAAELKNPGSLNPTLGLASGAICTARVNVNDLNLREGPGTNFRSLAKLQVGEDLSVVGRNNDLSWFQVKPASKQLGWVSASYVQVTGGDCSTAPVVAPAQ